MMNLKENEPFLSKLVNSKHSSGCALMWELRSTWRRLFCRQSPCSLLHHSRLWGLKGLGAYEHQRNGINISHQSPRRNFVLFTLIECCAINWYICLFIQINSFSPVKRIVFAPFLSDAETEAQSGEATCPRSPHYRVMQPGFEESFLMPKLGFSTPLLHREASFHIHVFIYSFIYTLNKYALGMYCQALGTQRRLGQWPCTKRLQDLVELTVLKYLFNKYLTFSRTNSWPDCTQFSSSCLHVL